MSLRPSTPSSEKDPLRFSKSLSFNADTGMMLGVELVIVDVCAKPEILKSAGGFEFRNRGNRAHAGDNQTEHTHTAGKRHKPTHQPVAQRA